MFRRNYSSLSEFSPALAAPNMGGISVISRRGRKEGKEGGRWAEKRNKSRVGKCSFFGGRAILMQIDLSPNSGVRTTNLLRVQSTRLMGVTYVA